MNKLKRIIEIIVVVLMATPIIAVLLTSLFYTLSGGAMLSEIPSIVSRVKNLEERMIHFSVAVLEIAEVLPNQKTGNHLAGQLIRSGTSVSLNYGEAQSGEPRKDFIHK